MDLIRPEFIFLNETLLFQFEAKAATDLLHGDYNYVLSSDDSADPELPFMKSKSYGGTMILWKRSLCEFISVLSTPSPSFAAITFRPPSSPPSVQVSLYLPTSGKETEFIEEVSKLRIFLEDLVIKDPDLLIFIRGDSNVNTNHATRLKIFDDFKSSLNLLSLPIGHKTYHHFLGHGLYDSDIDVVLYSKTENTQECVDKVLCRSDFPCIASHHDAIVSSFSLPSQPINNQQTVEAPEIPNTRMKILWNHESLPMYKELVSESLNCLRNRWLEPSSKTCVSVLLEVTSRILSSAASTTNKSLSLANASTPVSKKTPRVIQKSRNYLRRKLQISRNFPSETATVQLESAKKIHRKLVRALNSQQNTKEYTKMFSILNQSIRKYDA